MEVTPSQQLRDTLQNAIDACF